MQVIRSISELHKLLALPKPSHPSVSVIRLSDIEYSDSEIWNHFYLDVYFVALKRNCNGRMKYGQQYYDFDEGTMSFTAPKQVLSLEIQKEPKLKGYILLFHPNFILTDQLYTKIKDYTFFSYAVSEALHLSEKEEHMLDNLFEQITEEILHIDKHTQNVVISQIDLLLRYSNRFYERQFMTRKGHQNNLLVKFNELLDDYLLSGETLKSGLPTVQHLAAQLHLSSDYLSDLLRSYTGRSAQQHIHEKLIERGQELLSTTNFSVSQIAYYLGFEYPQSFSKFFKSKTNFSPVQFRQSFN